MSLACRKSPERGVEERQPQPALGEMIRVAEAAGDPDILQDVIFGRVAQEGFVVVDDLTVDPVDVLRTPGTGLAQPQLLDARLFIAGIDFAAVDRRIERPQQVARHSVTAADRGRTNQQGKEYEGKLFHSSKISRPAVPERLPEFEFRPATRLPGIYMYKYTKSGRILQFFARFSTAQAIIRGKPADRKSTYSGGGRATVRVMPTSRAKCRSWVTTSSVPRYPAMARARIPKQAGKKPGRAKPAGRNGTEKPEPTKQNTRGVFFGSTLCTRVKIRNLCGQNTAIGENATYHTEDGRALCGVPALLVGGGDRRGARTRPGGRRPAAKRTGAPGCRERRGCRKRRARKTHKGRRERRKRRGRRERRGRHVPQHGAGYDRHGRRG